MVHTRDALVRDELASRRPMSNLSLSYSGKLVMMNQLKLISVPWSTKFLLVTQENSQVRLISQRCLACIWLYIFTVFRELLQNSDDAQSKAVEIRFETQAYTDRNSQTQGTEGADVGKTELPDLKTTPVCDNCSSFDFRTFNLICRYTTGYLRITVFYFGTKTGAVWKRLVWF